MIIIQFYDDDFTYFFRFFFCVWYEKPNPKISSTHYKVAFCVVFVFIFIVFFIQKALFRWDQFRNSFHASHVAITFYFILWNEKKKKKFFDVSVHRLDSIALTSINLNSHIVESLLVLVLLPSNQTMMHRNYHDQHINNFDAQSSFYGDFFFSVSYRQHKHINRYRLIFSYKIEMNTKKTTTTNAATLHFRHHFLFFFFYLTRFITKFLWLRYWNLTWFRWFEYFFVLCVSFFFSFFYFCFIIFHFRLGFGGFDQFNFYFFTFK